MNNDNLGCFGTGIAIVLAVLFLAGNVALFSGDMEDLEFAVVIAVIADVVLLGFIIKGLLSVISNKAQVKSDAKLASKKKKLLEILQLKLETVSKRRKQLDEFYTDIEKTDKLLGLFKNIDTENNNLKFFEIADDKRFVKLKEYVSKIEGFNLKFDTNEDVNQYYCQLKNQIDVIKKDIKIINDATEDDELKKFEEKYINLDLKKANTTFYKKYKNIEKQHIKRKIKIISVMTVIVLVISSLLVFFSSSLATHMAKQSYLADNDFQQIISSNGITDVDVSNINFSEFHSSSKYKKYFVTFSARSDEISNYYSMEENSDKAKSLIKIMRSVYTEIADKEYTYNHNNGWEIAIEYSVTAPLTITDNKGHQYDYWKSDGLETLSIDGEYVIYND